MIKAEVLTKEVTIQLTVDLKTASLIHALTQCVGGCPYDSYRYDSDQLNRVLTQTLTEVDDLAMSNKIGAKVNKNSPRYGIHFHK